MLRDRPFNPLLSATAPPALRRVGVIGAGSIGPDLAYWLRMGLPEVPVALIDLRADALERARTRLAGYVDKGVRYGKLTAHAAGGVLSGLETGTDYELLRGCDWVIEAATESLGVKREIFLRTEALVPASAFITSNTSSLPAALIFCGLGDAGRASVTHFFAPAFRNPIVEVVDWAGVEGRTLLDLRALLAQLGKVPLLCQDVPCFMLDRLFDNWCNEAALLLEHASASEIDSVAQELAAAGPFHVLNLANGNPIILEANRIQALSEGAHYAPAPLFASVDRWRTVAPGRRISVAPELSQRIRDRLTGILLSQTVDILDRGIGERTDLELGARLALGLRSGPLELMQRMGTAEVQRLFERLQRERPGLPGPRADIAAYASFERHVLVDDLEDVKVLTLRRPEAANALDDRVNSELLSLLTRYEDSAAVSGFIITGYGPRAFCAGADIGRFPQLLGHAAAAAEYARECSQLLLHLDRMGKPVVAALNGVALGGGFELALRCRGIVALASARLQFPEITLGIVPGIGGMVVPFRRWPRAADAFVSMLARAKSLSAAQAHELGIVDETVPTLQMIWPRALALVRQLRSARAVAAAPVVPRFPESAGLSEDGRPLSAVVLGILRRAIENAALAESYDEALEIGYRAFGEAACTAAAREGIDAFLAGRAADFAKTG